MLHSTTSSFKNVRTECILKYRTAVASTQVSTSLGTSLPWGEGRHCRTYLTYVPSHVSLLTGQHCFIGQNHPTTLLLRCMLRAQHLFTVFKRIHPANHLPSLFLRVITVQFRSLWSLHLLYSLGLYVLPASVTQRLVDSEHFLPCHHCCPQVSQGASMLVGAGVCFLWQPLNLSTYSAALAFKDQPPSFPAAQGQHTSCTQHAVQGTPLKLLLSRSTPNGCGISGEAALEYQTFILVQGKWRNPFYFAHHPKLTPLLTIHPPKKKTNQESEKQNNQPSKKNQTNKQSDIFPLR